MPGVVNGKDNKLVFEDIDAFCSQPARWNFGADRGYLLIVEAVEEENGTILFSVRDIIVPWNYREKKMSVSEGLGELKVFMNSPVHHKVNICVGDALLRLKVDQVL